MAINLYPAVLQGKRTKGGIFIVPPKRIINITQKEKGLGVLFVSLF